MPASAEPLEPEIPPPPKPSRPIPRLVHPLLYLKFTDVTLCERIWRARLWMHLSQCEMAALLGVSQQDISKMERAKLPNPAFSAVLFCTVYREHLSFIFEEADERVGPGNDSEKPAFGSVRLHGKGE